MEEHDLLFHYKDDTKQVPGNGDTVLETIEAVHPVTVASDQGTEAQPIGHHVLGYLQVPDVSVVQDTLYTQEIEIGAPHFLLTGEGESGIIVVVNEEISSDQPQTHFPQNTILSSNAVILDASCKDQTLPSTTSNGSDAENHSVNAVDDFSCIEGVSTVDTKFGHTVFMQGDQLIEFKANSSGFDTQSLLWAVDENKSEEDSPEMLFIPDPSVLSSNPELASTLLLSNNSKSKNRKLMQLACIAHELQSVDLSSEVPLHNVEHSVDHRLLNEIVVMHQGDQDPSNVNMVVESSHKQESNSNPADINSLINCVNYSQFTNTDISSTKPDASDEFVGKSDASSVVVNNKVDSSMINDHSESVSSLENLLAPMTHNADNVNQQSFNQNLTTSSNLTCNQSEIAQQKSEYLSLKNDDALEKMNCDVSLYNEKLKIKVKSSVGSNPDLSEAEKILVHKEVECSERNIDQNTSGTNNISGHISSVDAIDNVHEVVQENGESNTIVELGVSDSVLNGKSDSCYQNVSLDGRLKLCRTSPDHSVISKSLSHVSKNAQTFEPVCTSDEEQDIVELSKNGLNVAYTCNDIKGLSLNIPSDKEACFSGHLNENDSTHQVLEPQVDCNSCYKTNQSSIIAQEIELPQSSVSHLVGVKSDSSCKKKVDNLDGNTDVEFNVVNKSIETDKVYAVDRDVSVSENQQETRVRTCGLENDVIINVESAEEPIMRPPKKTYGRKKNLEEDSIGARKHGVSCTKLDASVQNTVIEPHSTTCSTVEYVTTSAVLSKPRSVDNVTGVEMMGSFKQEQVSVSKVVCESVDQLTKTQDKDTASLQTRKSPRKKRVVEYRSQCLSPSDALDQDGGTSSSSETCKILNVVEKKKKNGRQSSRFIPSKQFLHRFHPRKAANRKQLIKETKSNAIKANRSSDSCASVKRKLQTSYNPSDEYDFTDSETVESDIDKCHFIRSNSPKRRGRPLGSRNKVVNSPETWDKFLNSNPAKIKNKKYLTLLKERCKRNERRNRNFNFTPDLVAPPTKARISSRKQIVKVLDLETEDARNNLNIHYAEQPNEQAEKHIALYNCSVCYYATDRIQNFILHTKTCLAANVPYSYAEISDMDKRQRIRGELQDDFESSGQCSTSGSSKQKSSIHFSVVSR